MKVTKYPQSHLVLEKNGKTLIIDPGYITFDKGFKVSDFQGADIYLITHQHADHLGPETIQQIVQNKPIYGNSDVVTKLQEIGLSQVAEIKDRESITVDGFEITAVNLPHFQKEGVVMPLNTGFLVDQIFFHPGDGDIAPDITSENTAVTLGGATITQESAIQFVKAIKAKVVIPVHYDVYKEDPIDFKEKVKDLGIEVRILKDSEATEI